MVFDILAYLAIHKEVTCRDCSKKAEWPLGWHRLQDEEVFICPECMEKEVKEGN